MPYISEDFLSTMDDDIEVGSESHNMSTSVISTLSERIVSTDELVPSLKIEEEFPSSDYVQ